MGAERIFFAHTNKFVSCDSKEEERSTARLWWAGRNSTENTASTAILWPEDSAGPSVQNFSYFPHGLRKDIAGERFLKPSVYIQIHPLSN